MNWNSTLENISSAALLLPILLILFYRLGAYKTFPALLIYYVIVLAYNIASGTYLEKGSEVTKYWSIANNFLDAPLVLYFLTYFSSSPSLTRKMKYVIIAQLVFQVLVLAIVGINSNAVTIFLGPAILIVFGFCLHFFVRQAKISVVRYKTLGKTIIAASLLFAYGCYAFIYLMYYVLKTPYVSDTFLVYFIVVTISSLVMGIGLYAEQKRIRKLNELLQTRKELSAIYNSDLPPVATLRTVALDFDKDPWV